MAEEEEEDGGPTAPFWMVTYADMVTLLLTFFVLIVAMSEMKKDHFMEAMSYFKGRMSVFENAQPVPIIPSDSETDSEKEREKAEMESIIEDLAKESLDDKVQIEYMESTTHIVITDSVMFASGRARLKTTAQRVLEIVANAVTDSTQSVTVIGHTDNIPIGTSTYPSNWELSAARAASVVRFLLTQNQMLPPNRYQAIGKGEFEPVGPNDTPEGRARNRRIELLISKDPWQNPTNNQERTILTE